MEARTADIKPSLCADLRIGFSFGEFSSRDYYLRLSWNRPTFTLAIAQASAEVTVAEEVPLIQAENGDASDRMNQTQISEVPNPGSRGRIQSLTHGHASLAAGPASAGANLVLVAAPIREAVAMDVADKVMAYWNRPGS